MRAENIQIEQVNKRFDVERISRRIVQLHSATNYPVSGWSAYSPDDWEARLNASIEHNRLEFQRWLNRKCDDYMFLPSFMRGWHPIDVLNYYKCLGVMPIDQRLHG